MQKPTFSPSVNIIRDADRAMVYYPTENTRRIVSQLVTDYHNGIRAFTLIGSYGTGKSAFLWAFEQNLNGNPYFRPHLFGNGPTQVIRLIGEFQSLSHVMAEQLNLPSTASSHEVFAALYYQHKAALTTGRLVILIDEFGKYLEYASQHDTAQAIYFVQELAEFVSDPRHNALLITTVHQNVDAYAFGLRKEQRQEWSKVKGRFQEITFNEPIEQLLRLAATHLCEQTRTDRDQTAIGEIVVLSKESRAFDLNAIYALEIATGLFPLDMLAAHVLAITLQRYGQNERSLFTFLESSDHTSLKRFRLDHPEAVYSISSVYDYLFFNFYSFLQSKHSPDHASWAVMRDGLDEIERVFDDRISDYQALFKTISLLNLTAAQGSTLDKKFLVRYAKTCLSIPDAGSLIDKLKQKLIVVYKPHAKRFVPNNGTTLDVEAALIAAEGKVEKSEAVAALLQRYDDLPPVLAKAYTFETGTPRLFDFIITDELRAERPTGDVDGFIYLIFNENLSLETVKAFSADHQDKALLYVFYENARNIIDLLYDLQKLEQVKADNNDDKVAIKLLDENVEATVRSLNHFILGNLYAGSAHLKWIWQGNTQPIDSQRRFNQLLSKVCKTIYPDTPTFWNELVNRHKISPSIFTARKWYFQHLVQYFDEPDLGFEKDRFPPEKTIYLTLLKQNGVNLNPNDPSFRAEVAEGSSFRPLWDCSETFLREAKQTRRPITEFIDLLGQSPFKLKQGLIDFWIPTYLFIKRNDFALFEAGAYIPDITGDILDLLVKNPVHYAVKAFGVDGVRLNLFNSYRQLLNQSTQLQFSNELFIDTVKPFLKFYRELPEYAKHTRRLSREALAVREAIANAREPEKTFFEDFPMALGYSLENLQVSENLFETYIGTLQEAITEIRTCYDALISRFENFILQEFIGEEVTFADYKPQLQARFQKLSRHLLQPTQKTFVQRLDSQLDDRKAWLNSMAQAVVGRSLDVLRDADESVLYDKFKRTIRDLDNLTHLVKSDVDVEKEDVFSLEISSFVDGISKDLVRIPASKKMQVAQVEANIRTLLHTDTVVNIVALTNVLKELLKK